jgi:hypothetical protein
MKRGVKFVSITAFNDSLFALDAAGQIWVKPKNNAGDWEKIPGPEIELDDRGFERPLPLPASSNGRPPKKGWLK